MTHVLVVDDEEDMRLLLRMLLGRQGYRVTEAGDGAAALAAIAVERPDLLITDGMMPRMHGAQLIAAIRNDPELASLLVVLYWVPGDPGVTEATVLAVDAALEKGEHPDEIVRRVRHLTAKGRKWEYASDEDIYAPLLLAVRGHASLLRSGRLDHMDPELRERSRALVVTSASRLRDALEAPLGVWPDDLQEWRANLSIGPLVLRLREAANAADYTQVLAIGAEIESALHGNPARRSGSEAGGGAGQ